jgi:hypothetical protein
MTGLTTLRVLLNDQTAAEFADSDLQVFLDTAGFTGVAGDSTIYLAAMLATQSLVVKYASLPVHQVSIGGFETSLGRTQARFLESQADRWYQLYLDAPACGVAEENLSGFNELTIIRNWVLKHEG